MDRFYLFRSEPTISSDNGKNGNQLGGMDMDISDETVVKKITLEEEEEEEEEGKVTNLVRNRESGCRRDKTERYFLF